MSVWSGRAAIALAIVLAGCMSEPVETPAPDSPREISCGAVCGIPTAPQYSTEPSAAIDPTNPDRLLVAAIEGTGAGLPPGTPNPPLQYPGWAFLSVRYSHDGGSTWTRVRVPYAGNAPTGSAWNQFCVTADPVVLYDAKGVAHLFGLGWPCSQSVHPATPPSYTSVGSIWMSTSRDAGATWGEPSFVTRSPGLAEWPDKEWAAIDPNTGKILVVWQGLAQGNQILRTAISADQGKTWTAPGQVTSNTQERSNAVLMPMAVFDDASTAYVAYRACSGACLKVAYSGDLVSWTSVKVADVGVVKRSGAEALMTWLPSLAFDASTGLLVANWQGGTDGSDVWVAVSADRGRTWSEPWAVNSDSAGDATDQFMSWVATSGDGTAHAFYYDRQAKNQTQARYARIDLVNHTSKLAWASSVAEPLRSTPSFNGDYQAMAAVPGRALLAWVQTQDRARPVFASVFDG